MVKVSSPTNPGTSATIDTKEIAALLEDAGIAAGHAHTRLRDLRSLFEAIAKDLRPGSLALRLASLGAGLCEESEIWFAERETAFDSHSDRFTASAGLAGDHETQRKGEMA